MHMRSGSYQLTVDKAEVEKHLQWLADQLTGKIPMTTDREKLLDAYHDEYMFYSGDPAYHLDHIKVV